MVETDSRRTGEGSVDHGWARARSLDELLARAGLRVWSRHSVLMLDASERGKAADLGLLIELASDVYGRADRHTVEAITTCVVDLPSGILRRHLTAGRRASPATAARLEACVRAVLSVPPDSDQPDSSRRTA